MDMLTIAQVGISLFGCAAFLLVLSDDRRKQRVAVILGLLSNPFWWAMVIATEQWITVPVHLLYTFGWLRKAYILFWRERRERFPRTARTDP